MQPPIPRPRLPYSREASPPPPLPIHEWRASTRRTCQGPPTLRPKKLTIPTPPQATYPTPPAPSRPTLHLDLPYTHSRPPCTTHTSPSPAGLPYTAAPDTAPTRLPYTSRSQLAHPTLRLPPTHLPYTRLPTLHHAPTPRTYTTHAAAQAAYPTPRQRRSAACRVLAAPYPSQPTLQPPPSNDPSPPSPDRLPYTPFPGTTHKMRRPRQKLPRRPPLPRQPKSRLCSPPHPRPDQPTLYPPQPRQVETTPKYRRGNPSKSSNSSTTPVTSP